MNPSQELRLRTLIRTVSETIIPAIRDDAPLAMEQAGLLVAHLNVLLEQGNREQEVDLFNSAALKALAGELLNLSSGEIALEREREALASALGGDYATLSFATERLLASTAGSFEFKQRSMLEALKYTRKQNQHGRSWFQGTGFDSSPQSLSSVESLLAVGS